MKRDPLLVALVVLVGLVLIASVLNVRVYLPGSSCGTTFVGPCPLVEIGW